MHAALRTVLTGPGKALRPVDLGAALLACWDAGSGVTTGAGGVVTSWADQVAGYAAVQATAGKQPVYSAAGFNGGSGVTFDGVDDFLSMESCPFPIGTSPVELWAVVSQDRAAASGSTSAVLSYGGNSAATSRQLARVNGSINKAQLATGNGTSGSVLNESVTDFSGRHVLRGAVSATGLSLSVDGNASVALAVVPGTTATRTRIGATTANTAVSFFLGTASLLLITAPLSDAQAAGLTRYLKSLANL